MPKVHPEFEQGYREGHENGYNLGRRAVDFAKRELAEKVLRVVEAEERSRFGESATGISSAVRDFFTESGVTVEQEG